MSPRLGGCFTYCLFVFYGSIRNDSRVGTSEVAKRRELARVRQRAFTACAALWDLQVGHGGGRCRRKPNMDARSHHEMLASRRRGPGGARHLSCVVCCTLYEAVFLEGFCELPSGSRPCGCSCRMYTMCSPCRFPSSCRRLQLQQHASWEGAPGNRISRKALLCNQSPASLPACLQPASQGGSLPTWN